MAETIKGAKELCRKYYELDYPTWLHGPPGVGKSDLWAQLAQEAKIGFIDIRLGMYDLVDLVGLPHIVNGRTAHAMPEMWPVKERDGAKGIICFDEISDVSRTMQSITYQIILNRAVGPHKLLPGWYPCAAGNRREDKAAAQSISTALANRFAHIDVTADVNAWIEWADKAEINPLVIGFIRFRPNLLHSMEGADLRAFPTPRSWAKASAVCETDKSVRYRLLAGLVGAGAAGEFDGYLRTLDLPDLDEIVKNPSKCRIPKEPASKYALSSMLARYAERKNFMEITTYTKRPDFGRDFNICCVLDATKRDASLTETKAFIDFANLNADLSL